MPITVITESDDWDSKTSFPANSDTSLSLAEHAHIVRAAGALLAGKSVPLQFQALQAAYEDNADSVFLIKKAIHQPSRPHITFNTKKNNVLSKTYHFWLNSRDTDNDAAAAKGTIEQVQAGLLLKKVESFTYGKQCAAKAKRTTDAVTDINSELTMRFEWYGEPFSYEDINLTYYYRAHPSGKSIGSNAVC